MAWVSVHDNVIGGKLRELAKEIGRTQEEALGILVSLWLWGLNNADKNGRLISADRDDVLEAFSVRLVGEVKADLVDTLIKTRWLDEPEPGVLYIHDWDQWQAQWYKAMERRERDAKRKADSRKGKAGGPSNQMDAPILPGVFPEPEPPAKPPDSPKRNEYPVPFEAFWQAYPRQIGKGEAYKKYQARRKDGYSDDDLIEAAKNYARDCRKRKTEKEYIKHPKTFLSDNLPFLDYLPKNNTKSQEAPSSSNPCEEWRDDS